MGVMRDMGNKHLHLGNNIYIHNTYLRNEADVG